MFQTLASRLQGIFTNLSQKGILKESHVSEALQEIRFSLIEADVAIDIANQIIEQTQQKIKQRQVLRSVTPGQQVIALVHETLVKILTKDSKDLIFQKNPPSIWMIVGPQGSGKTTTTAKLANYIQNKHNKRVFLASLDITRPAAQNQLHILAKKIQSNALPIIANQTIEQITQHAMHEARIGGYDVLIFDTAGRISTNKSLMQELESIKKLTQPCETLLVADSMLGQDSVKMAKNFHTMIQLSGIILTRIDGDSKGGAALSMTASTNCPIKFIGNGENIWDLDLFDPSRMVDRIFGHGDIIQLVQKAEQASNIQEDLLFKKNIKNGEFSLDDMLIQIKKMKKMGGIKTILSLLPKKISVPNNIDNTLLKKQEAIILSMTDKEKKNPSIIHASRKKRIAMGSGTQIQDINKLLKQWLTMKKMIKKMNRFNSEEMNQNMENILGNRKF